MHLSHKSITVLRRLLLGIATLVTLVALVIAVENWRGDLAWTSVERELKAKGEWLGFAAYWPARVPDEINLFKAPLLSSVLYDIPTPEKKKILEESKLRNLFFAGHTGTATAIDLVALRDHFKRVGRLGADNSEPPAVAVLAALEPLGPLLDELRQAAHSRTAASIEHGGQPFELPMVDVSVAFSLGQAATARATAELNLNRTSEAFGDILGALRLGNGLAMQPMMMNLLVGEAIQLDATRPIAEGRQRHVWSEAQLAEFQRLLLESDPLAVFSHATRAECAAVVQFIDLWPAMPPSATGHPPAWPRWLFHGWRQQNKAEVWAHTEEIVLSSFTTSPQRIYSDRLDRAQQATRLLSASLSPYEWVSKRTLTNFSVLLHSIGVNADSTMEAATACALERYSLVHGHYPEKLDELVPAFLHAVPSGIFDGQSMRYTNLPESGRQIYFIGPNGRDDGGQGDDHTMKLSQQ